MQGRDTFVTLATGFVLNDRYVIEKEIGRGGVGVVYKATDRQLVSRPVVIKVLLEHVVRDDWVRGKFRQEMEALSRMDHPGIVGLLDTGELPDGRLYLVLQWINGVPLCSLIRPEGMDLERAGALIRQISAALSVAHKAGVLHRDMKPENVMIQSPGPQEQAKLIDFGLAKVANSRVAESTAIPNIAGTFAYTSPEQLTARPLTPASDIYSLGVMAHEMVTGRRPHNPDSMFQLLEMVRAGVRVRPMDLRPSIPAAMNSLILQALDPDPLKRPKDADEFGAAFENSLRSPIKLARAAETEITPGGSGTPMLWSISWLVFGAAIVVWMRNAFFRFDAFVSMLIEPMMISFVVGYVVLSILIFRWKKTARHTSPAPVIALVLLSVFVFAFSIPSKPVANARWIRGNPQNVSGFTLNYSDPRGYQYTFQNDSYYRLDLDPGRFNRMSDYELKVILSPEVEFADIYMDGKFGNREQLTLAPSSSNDILLLHRQGDRFTEPRSILFTLKSRTPPEKVHLEVDLKTPGATLAYAF